MQEMPDLVPGADFEHIDANELLFGSWHFCLLLGDLKSAVIVERGQEAPIFERLEPKW